MDPIGHFQSSAELAAAIYEYKDVFSSGPDPVTHYIYIDSGEHRPICFPPT